MYVGTTEAASLLNISPRRLRKLLAEGRVRGAYKSRSLWIIPLFNGVPLIFKGLRGPVGTWRKKRQPAVTQIKVNRHKIDANKNKPKSKRTPVISVVQGKRNSYGSQVEITGASRIIYRPEKPLSCGATLWIETLEEVFLIEQFFPAEQVY